MNIDGHTIVAGVAGWPIAHSLSPRLHQFWLREHAINGAYVPLAIARTDFASVVEALRKAGFAGINVTVPHKQAAFAIAHELDDAARLTGAANLLLFCDGRIEGRNTDSDGLYQALHEALGESAKGKKAVLLGAGGAARGAALALARLGISDIAILNRNEVRAQNLANAFADKTATTMHGANLDAWSKYAGDAALVVNATSAGMTGNAPLDLALDALDHSAAVCDIVYNPLQTELLKGALARGLKVIDGLGMLMHQAVPAFAAFYGITPKVSPALRAELEGALGA